MKTEKTFFLPQPAATQTGYRKYAPVAFGRTAHLPLPRQEDRFTPLQRSAPRPPQNVRFGKSAAADTGYKAETFPLANGQTLQVRTYGNGHVVAFKEDRKHPSFSLLTLVKAGSAYENDKFSGGGHFFEHMNFKGYIDKDGRIYTAEDLNWSSQMTLNRNDAYAYDHDGSAWMVSGDDFRRYVEVAKNEGENAAGRMIAAQPHRVEEVRFDKYKTTTSAEGDMVTVRKRGS